MSKTTQAEACLAFLRKHGSGTYRELMLYSGSNWPHKRLDEVTGPRGEVYESRMIQDAGKRWLCTGETIIREKRKVSDRWITLVRLIRATGAKA